MADDDVLWDFDEDDEAFLAEWDEADRAAGDLLREACAQILGSPAPEPDFTHAQARLRTGIEGRGWPFGYFVEACGWHRATPDRDDELWLQAAQATISPPNDPGTDPEEQAAVFSLLHADWFGIVVGLVRRGPGATFDGPSALHDIASTLEIDDDSDDLEADAGALDMAAAVLTPLWQSLGILDDWDRVTPLGVWGLPHALERVWTNNSSAG